MTTPSIPETVESDPTDLAYARMLHNGELLTWLVRTAGKATVALLLPTIIGMILGAITGEVALWGLGSLLGVLCFVVALTGAIAPVPSPLVLSYLGTGEDEENGRIQEA